eukprot:TRINITY_DN7028_c0_g2_i3.p1 TRINITY_DN7028_c0_g2~~TRINITY_DN7028_c0_g2_i3.p1  ORF type:complete len:233 (-),score=47.21 TRINITY_DN7028_c0_g2_i3:168-866(-)
MPLGKKMKESHLSREELIKLKKIIPGQDHLDQFRHDEVDKTQASFLFFRGRGTLTNLHDFLQTYQQEEFDKDFYLPTLYNNKKSFINSTLKRLDSQLRNVKIATLDKVTNSHEFGCQFQLELSGPLFPDSFMEICEILKVTQDGNYACCVEAFHPSLPYVNWFLGINGEVVENEDRNCKTVPGEDLGHMDPIATITNFACAPTSKLMEPVYLTGSIKNIECRDGVYDITLSL